MTNGRRDKNYLGDPERVALRKTRGEKTSLLQTNERTSNCISADWWGTAFEKIVNQINYIGN